MSHPVVTPSEEMFVALQKTDEFQNLRSRFRSFAFPLAVAFIAWYVFYIVTATFAVDFVNRPVFGYVNVGLLLGLAQFVTAGLVTWAYVRFADNKIDPATASLRERMDEMQRDARPTPKNPH